MQRRLSKTVMVAATLAVVGLLTPGLAVADAGADTEEASADAGEATPAVTLEEMTVQQQDDEDADQPQEAQPETDDAEFVRTVGMSALWGAGAGAAVGLAFFLITLGDASVLVIPQFAGGGLLIGGVVGLVQAMADTEPDPATQAIDERPDSVDYVTQPAPTTVDVSIFEQRF